MGTEYSHGIFVPDLSWRPTWSHVERITAVLRAWGFELQDDAYYELADGGASPIDEAAARAMPANLMVALEGPEGTAAARLMGASIYPEIPDADRYVADALLVLGSDFKVMANIENDEVEITRPAMDDGEELEARDDMDPFPPEAVVFPATWSATPPRTSVRQGFSRVWRVGLLLDCNKDVPKISQTKTGVARAFIEELQRAVDTPLAELGWLS